MKLGIEDKVFIVTGASSGIGAATARRLSQEGAQVMMVARREEPLGQAAASCQGETATVAIDVTAEDAAERIVKRCDEAFGRVDGLVNNAGGARLIPPEELTDADW